MDRWKSRGGKSQRREEQKRENQRRERVRRKKMQVREKVAKSRSTVFFQRFVAPESRKVGSLKRRVQSHVARREMNNCTPLWREARVQVKMYKTHHARSTFGSWDVEKVQNTPCSDIFGSCDAEKVWKSARRCGAKHMSKSKCTKHTMLGALFGSWDVEKVHAVVAWSTFPNQNVKGTILYVRTTFGCLDVVLRSRRKGFCTLSKVSKTWGGFVVFPKMMAGVGHLKRTWKDAFCVAYAVQETCSSEMLGGKSDGRRNTSETWTGKIAKLIGTRPSALHSTFHYWRKSRGIASFLMLPRSKIEEVSRKCFVFDVANFKNWGSFAE